MLDGLNFKEFVAFLSAFSPRTSLQQKIECWYRIIRFSISLDVLSNLFYV